jgi:hypothetical protein
VMIFFLKGHFIKSRQFIGIQPSNDIIFNHLYLKMAISMHFGHFGWIYL